MKGDRFRLRYSEQSEISVHSLIFDICNVMMFSIQR